MIVDTHMHIHTAHINPGEQEMFGFDRYMNGKGPVDVSIIFGMQFNIPGRHIPNDHIAEVVAMRPKELAGFCSVFPHDDNAVSEIERSVKQLGLIGLKLHPLYQAFYPNDRRYFPLYKKCLDLGIPVAFHTAHTVSRQARLVYGDVLLLDDVAIEFPDLKIIICHMGYTQYINTINLIKKHPNVFTDCSNFGHLAGFDTWLTDHFGIQKPAVHYPYFHLVEPFLYNFSTPGEQHKILFGTDFPNIGGEKALKVLEELPAIMKQMGLPPIPKPCTDRIVHENWKQVFKIDSQRRLIPAAW